MKFKNILFLVTLVVSLVASVQANQHSEKIAAPANLHFDEVVAYVEALRDQGILDTLMDENDNGVRNYINLLNRTQEVDKKKARDYISDLILEATTCEGLAE